MSTSQLGEFPQVVQNMLSSGNQIFQDFSGGMPLPVGKKREKYFTAEHILLPQIHHYTNIYASICSTNCKELKKRGESIQRYIRHKTLDTSRMA